MGCRLDNAVHQVTYQVGIRVDLGTVTIRHCQPVRFQVPMAVELVNSVSIRHNASVNWVKGLIVLHTVK